MTATVNKPRTNRARVWVSVVFLAEDEAREALAVLDILGEQAALDYLKQWEMCEPGPTRSESPAGDDDATYAADGYEMNYNLGLGYIGLSRIE